MNVKPSGKKYVICTVNLITGRNKITLISIIADEY